MSIEENLAEPTDDDLFNEAVSDEAPETPAVAEVAETEQQPDRPRDEAGRFAAKTEETPTSERPEVDDNAAQVPSWRVREINEEKRSLAEKVTKFESEQAQWRQEQQELRQRLASFEKPKPTTDQAAENEPDPLLDPKGYREHIKKEIREDILNDRRETSLQQAHVKYKEEFQEAYAAAQQKVDPALKARMQQSRDPGETLIQWHREQKTMSEVGSDPNAWLEKKLEERLKDPTFLAKAVELARGNPAPQPDNGRPRVNLPPSLNSTSRSNALLTSVQDVSDGQLFDEITN